MAKPKLTQAELAEQRIEDMASKELIVLLLQAKGSREASANRVADQILRDAIRLCVRIGRLSLDQVVPLKEKKLKS